MDPFMALFLMIIFRWWLRWWVYLAGPPPVKYGKSPFSRPRRALGRVWRFWYWTRFPWYIAAAHFSRAEPCNWA
jgi:hypothetical protein